MFVFRILALTIVVTGISFSEDQIPRNFIARSIEVPDHPSIAAYAEKFSSGQWRPWLESVIERGSFYALHIIEQIESRQLPPELLYLPVIESEYFNNAISPAGAVGLWQLMKGTAQFYGLVIDDIIDERRDFWKATHVALSILESNYKEFGNWSLALASYNSGLGRVRKAVRIAGKKDFWYLRERGLLPAETNEFVPRFFGLVEAMKNYPITNYPLSKDLHHWRRVSVPGSIELQQLAKLTGIPADVLELANAELFYGLTPDQSHTIDYQIKIPAKRYERLVAVIRDPDNVLVRIYRHTIRSGDTMSELAEVFGISVPLIQQYNTSVDPRRMRVGVGLHIPLVGGFEPDSVNLSNVVETRAFDTIYNVVRGDSLWAISLMYRTTVEALASANGSNPNEVLYAGQELRVPSITNGRNIIEEM